MKNNSVKKPKRNFIITSLKWVVKKLGLYSLFFPPPDKYEVELAFQTMWAKEFQEHKHMVLEYWETYRYLNEIKSITAIQANSKILDVGCGISTVLHFIPGERYGIDPLAEQYRKLYAYPDDIHIQKGMGEDSIFPNEFFDVIFCTNVLDHVTSPPKTIDNILRMVKGQGYFILTLELFEESIERDAAHPHCLTKPKVMELLGHRCHIVREMESPWIGLRRYVLGERSHKHNELILILQKNP